MSVRLLWKTKPLKKFSIFNEHVCPSVPLFCYTCVFPAISPLDCIRFPLKCPPGQVCLSSRAVGEKGEGRLQSTEQNLNESKLRKRTENDRFKHIVSVVLLCVSLKIMFLMILRRVPCGFVWEELHPPLPVWNHGWKTDPGTQLHLHQWMLWHTPVQWSCNTCYPLLDWHINHTPYFILSLVNREILKRYGRKVVWHTCV